MASFYNQATLTYNGNTTTSNITTGEILEVLSVTKTAVVEEYGANDTVTYIVSIVNTGSLPYTGLTVTDNLGAYAEDTLTLVPLTYTEGSVRYFIDGVLQPAPAADPGAPLVFSGISVPAGGSISLIYAADVNAFAPLAQESVITNTVTVSGGGLTAPLTAEETVTVTDAPFLAITKSLNPSSVAENGRITYTFIIENYGNTAAETTDSVTVTDTFDPILENISVTLDGTALTAPADYTYDETTGLFTSTPGRITVPAASFTRTATGEVAVTPGVSVLTITGNI